MPWLRRGLRGLKEAGCGAVAIPCNTAHGWYADLGAEGLPILHIVDAAADALGRVASPGVVGLMATAHTLRLRLYQDRLERRGWECLVPTDAEMADAVGPAIALVKANRVGEAAPALAAVARALAARGAQAVVLGCTEIALALPAAQQFAIGLPVIDSIDALALAAIGWARG